MTLSDFRTSLGSCCSRYIVILVSEQAYTSLRRDRECRNGCTNTWSIDSQQGDSKEEGQSFHHMLLGQSDIHM